MTVLVLLANEKLFDAVNSVCANGARRGLYCVGEEVEGPCGAGTWSVARLDYLCVAVVPPRATIVNEAARTHVVCDVVAGCGCCVVCRHRKEYNAEPRAAKSASNCKGAVQGLGDLGSTSKYYAVRKDRMTGVFRSWGDCKDEVFRFKGAEYKAFATIEEARSCLRG